MQGSDLFVTYRTAPEMLLHLWDCLSGVRLIKRQREREVRVESVGKLCGAQSS